MRAKVTFPGAYHHVMNRGVMGENIFIDNKAKDYFLNIIRAKSQLQRIKILAYCIMDNHYHLILEDTSSRLSEFMRHVNGQYGIYYRKRVSGKGYVFQDRYKSILIQGDVYLKMAIAYVLLNPLRGRITENPCEYRWTSIMEYFTGKSSNLVDNTFVEALFKNKERMDEFLEDWAGKDIPVKKTRFGDILGNKKFIEEAVEKFDRRKSKGKSTRKRLNDYIFEPPEEVINRFEEEMGSSIDEIKVETREGKRLRSELLVLLKDRSGLKYGEIKKYKPFSSLKYSSLGQIYKRAKDNMEKEKS